MCFAGAERKQRAGGCLRKGYVMEKRVLFDRDKNATGETINQGEPVPKGRYLHVMVIWIENAEGSFLIQKTSKQKGEEWTTTGGHRIRGETSVEAIKREVKEELGIEIPEEIRFIGCIEEEACFIDVYSVKKDIELEEMRLQEEEVQEVRWMKKEEIEEKILRGEFHRRHAKFFAYYKEKM